MSSFAHLIIRTSWSVRLAIAVVLLSMSAAHCRSRRPAGSEVDSVAGAYIQSAYGKMCGALQNADAGKRWSASSTNSASELRPSAAAVKQIIEKRSCSDCHSAANQAAGLSSISLSELSQRGLVQDGRMTVRLREALRRMPDGGDKNELLGDGEIAAFEAWIAEGGPTLEAKTEQSEPSEISFITDNDIVSCVTMDLKLESGNNPIYRDQHLKDFRYFSLAHIYNSRDYASLGKQVLGLKYLLNSLTWNQAPIVIKPIDPMGLIYRVQLTNLGWKEAQWKKVEDSNRIYPFSLFFGPVAEATLQRAIQTATKTEQPLVRADWFIKVASFPPLYYDLLELPVTEQELEHLVRLSTRTNYETNRESGFLRVGTTLSDVAPKGNSRVLERHELLQTGGYYWKSYDFAPAQGNPKRDLLKFPLSFRSDGRNFEPDGGEIIFSLPNGMQAYYIANAKGERLDEAPVNVVSNKDDQLHQHKIFAGYSCMGCHSAGLLGMKDIVRPHYERLNAQGGIGINPVDLETVSEVLNIYKGQQEFDRWLDADSKLFQAAVFRVTGQPAEAKLQNSVYRGRQQFIGLLPRARIAAELGLDLARFNGLAPYVEELQSVGESMDRNSFEGLFVKLKCGSLFEGHANECRKQNKLAERADDHKSTAQIPKKVSLTDFNEPYMRLVKSNISPNATVLSTHSNVATELRGRRVTVNVANAGDIVKRCERIKELANLQKSAQLIAYRIDLKPVYGGYQSAVNLSVVGVNVGNGCADLETKITSGAEVSGEIVGPMRGYESTWLVIEK